MLQSYTKDRSEIKLSSEQKKELEKRKQQHLSGESKSIPWKEVKDHLRQWNIYCSSKKRLLMTLTMLINVQWQKARARRWALNRTLRILCHSREWSSSMPGPLQKIQSHALKRFPYLIVYEIEQKYLIVYASSIRAKIQQREMKNNIR